MHALKAQAMGCEELSGALGASVMEVLRELSCLEVAGRLRRGRDGRYSVVVLEKANILK
jgi:DNA-binding IclR family transcriptional regulator